MMKNNCGFEHEYIEGELFVRLRGEIDHHSAAMLRGDIDALIYEKRPQRLLLDLSGVGFMDSSGLGLIMGRYSLVRELGGSMAILDPTEPIMKILNLAGVKRIIAIEKTKGAKKK
ncbi:MAG: STAS domain-containing protein [Eubacteriales bacterium]|jgi:stage II sporulation protein AA (anti-sigma F factor antagonist)